MTRTLIHATLILVVATVSAVSGFAQTAVDARLLFTPIQVAKDAPSAQQSGFIRPMMLQHSVARSVFEVPSKNLTLSNFPLPENTNSTLVLQRTRAVVDANTEFITHTKAGRVAFKVGPVISYRGTVNNDPNTAVSLHYSEGNITGYVQMANGKKTLIGRDYSVARSADGTAHTIADEATMLVQDPIARFICANEELPTDPETVVRLMSIPPMAKSSSKSVEQGQAEYLREFKLAVVLREDLDSIMKRRGDTDEEVAQYFVKIIAGVSQAYEQELDATIYITLLEKYTSDEPTGYFYDGKDVPKLKEEFARDWSASRNSVDRSIAHMFALYRSGGSNVLGIGTIASMCNKKITGGYSVSAAFANASQIPGDPKRSNGYVSDLEVTAHELGHDVGALHTHNCYWSPPIDTCMLQSDNTDGCYNNPSLRRVVPGTIMSYCEDVNGNNKPLTFGDRVADRMRGWMAAAECNLLITRPEIHITEPRGSTLYNLGDPMPIRWVSARVGAVNISWGGSATGPWTAIASNVNAADRSYLWTIPALPATTFWIRVEGSTEPDAHDTSIASYRINVPVVLDAPKGGERLGQGSTYSIRWTKGSGVGNVKLEYAPDGTAYEVLLESSNATSHNWIVPNVSTDIARIRVAAVSAPSAASTSGTFTIGAPRFVLELPEEGGALCKNQLNQFRWSADFIPNIRIQYSTDNGANWRTATQQSTIDVTVRQVFSRNVNMNNVPAGSIVKLRVIDAANEAVLATRDSLRIDSCNAAVSVNEQETDMPFAITSVSPNPASSIVRLGVSATSQRQIDVVLVSVDGRELILRSDLSLNTGSSTLDVPLNDVAPGSYRIAVRHGSIQVIAPLVIVR
ncbi:MAG: hypothetical protein H7X70_03595 [Candidatus Kapabacteria bacterium]|nr:hypothetical protein [Candidatus Kapabacteria bacterium]